MEHAKHIIRAVFLLLLIAVAFVLVRHFLLPKTFGMHGHYRFASVAEHASRPAAHGGPEACGGCHEHADEMETLSAGKHVAVSCEACHAPLGTHVTNKQRVSDMSVHRSFKLCARCHRRLVARPKGFPQVVLPDHVIENGEEMTEAICLECHDAHDPGV